MTLSFIRTANGFCPINSSGEKQMLVILLTVLVRNEEHCVLFMDEPEASLHIEWQQKLIGMIRGLNPNV